MAPAATVSVPPSQGKPGTTVHPLLPLTEAEISQAHQLIQAEYPAEIRLHHKHLTLQEPSKAELLQWFDAEASGEAVKPIDRRAITAYYIRKTV